MTWVCLIWARNGVTSSSSRARRRADEGRGRRRRARRSGEGLGVRFLRHRRLEKLHEGFNLDLDLAPGKLAVSRVLRTRERDELSAEAFSCRVEVTLALLLHSWRPADCSTQLLYSVLHRLPMCRRLHMGLAGLPKRLFRVSDRLLGAFLRFDGAGDFALSVEEGISGRRVGAASGFQSCLRSVDARSSRLDEFIVRRSSFVSQQFKDALLLRQVASCSCN